MSFKGLSVQGVGMLPYDQDVIKVKSNPYVGKALSGLVDTAVLSDPGVPL